MATMLVCCAVLAAALLATTVRNRAFAGAPNMVAGTSRLLFRNAALRTHLRREASESTFKVMFATVIESLRIRFGFGLPSRFAFGFQRVQLFVQPPIGEHPQQSLPQMKQEEPDDAESNQSDYAVEEVCLNHEPSHPSRLVPRESPRTLVHVYPLCQF